MNLIKYKWYRDLFSTKTFALVNDEWIDYKNYISGKITRIEGKWNTQAFCKCGNELTHSNSYAAYKDVKNTSIWEYNCSSCGKKQYWSPDYIPGLLPCNENGIPL